jgi:SulP family sulfate permease
MARLPTGGGRYDATVARPNAAAAGAWIRRWATDVRPRHLIQDLTAGSVSAVVTLSYSVSYAVLVFNGPQLEPFLPVGLQSALMAAAIVALVVALASSLPVAIGGPDSNATAVLAVMAASVATSLAARGLPPEHVAAAVLLMLAVSAVLTGVAVALLGVLRWGRAVRFLPYPVAGGFLAGSGYLVLIGGFTVLSGEPPSWSDARALAETSWLAWVTSLTVATGLLVLPRLIRHFLVLPGVVVAGIIGFYVALAAHGWDLDTARAQGLLMQPIAPGARALPSWPPAEAWSALAAEWDTFLAMLVVVFATILLNASGLELGTRREVDLDRELRSSGLASIASGLAGGMVGYLSFSRSLLNAAAGATSRAAGVWAAVLCSAALLFTPLVFYIPRPVLAGLLIYLGFALLREWLWDAYFKLPLLEYALIVGIVVVVAWAGILAGVAVGLLVASVLFSYSYSRSRFVRHHLPLGTHRSNKERSLVETASLGEHGHLARALCLQGYLFFGTASSLVDTCRDLVSRDGIRFLLLDFRMVQGLDASAGLAFARLQQLCGPGRAQLVVSGLRPEAEAVLRRMRVIPHEHLLVVSDLDHGLEWIEDRLLDGASAPDRAGGEIDLRQMLAGHLSPDMLEELARLCETVTLAKDAVLIRRGDPDDALYFVEQGQLAVLLDPESGARKRVRAIMAGTLVGEIALYSGQPRSADVIAETACRVRRLSAAHVARLQREHPALAIALHRFVLRVVSQRLIAATDEVRALL